MIDQLANEYAGQPVVFLEYNVDNAPTSRLDRWMAAFSGGTAYLPLVMVDSGQQIRNGYLDFYNVYRNMVNTALARPALAEIDAQWERIGNRVRFSVELTNLATTTLSASNGATLHAIVYQEAHISLTNRYVRTVVSTPITNLAPGAIATFTLETSDLSGVNWDQLRYLVLADYRPNGSVGAYDMLQAAIAMELPDFSVDPDWLVFAVDTGDPLVPSAKVNFEGLDSLNWTSTENASWLTITPSSGTMTTQPVITISKSDLAPGWQTVMVNFTTTGGVYSDQITVDAYLGSVFRTYLPLVR